MKTIRKRWMQWISMILAVVLLSESAIGNGNIVLASVIEDFDIENENNQEILSETAETENEPSVSDEDVTENLNILFEMEENRGQSSKYYRLSDGSIMAADYGMDVHYLKDGAWEDIDNRFVYEEADDADDMEGFATAAGDVEFKFAPDSSGGEVVRTSYEDYTVSFEFLGAFAEPVSQENEITEVPIVQDNLMEETTVSTGDNSLESDEEQETFSDGMDFSGRASSRPITFISGDLLNLEEAAQALEGTLAEDSLAALTDAESQDISAASAYLMGGAAAADNDTSVTKDVTDEIWAEVGTENMDKSEKDSLVRQAALEHAVTSVGYEEVLDGVSLQYVAAGSSLKEYILVNEPQDSYEYVFALNLGNLIPASQSDGSILLLDEESGEVVYEIPEAYMTDAAGAYSDDVEMVLEKESDGRYLMKIYVDKEWLSDEERVFPVKIDPTLNKLLSSTNNIRGNYVKSLEPDATSTNYGEMFVGYDSSGNGNMITYIQLRNLETLPKDSVICAAMFNMAVLSYSQVAWSKMYIQAKEVTAATTWSSNYNYNNRPAVSSEILDHRAVTSDSIGKYVAWNITELVKKHYDEGNVKDDIFAFSLEAYGTMSNSKCANTALNLLWDGAEPVLQILYRDTRGVEDYYSYQNQSVGNAGTAYVGDYTSQLTLVKPLVSYNSTSMPYELGIVYNTAYSDGYFTNGGDVHSKNFTNMLLGKGWKLTAQETVVPISITDMENTTTYLVYNDSDGTEHYFKETTSGSGKYEDEDGLNLTITKSGSNYTMTDKKSNEKYFSNGCLTYIKDANGNQIHIVYNNGTYTSNKVNESASNRITSIVSQPKSGKVKILFELTYDSLNFLSYITAYNDRTSDNYSKKILFSYAADSSGRYQLRQISRANYYKASEDKTGTWETAQIEAQYRYYNDSDSGNRRMYRIYDAESKYGIEYSYIKSDTGFRTYAWHEYAASSVDGTQTTGAKVRTWNTQLRQTRYRDAGEDRILTDAADKDAVSDDIVTTYFFNSSGQTINARSETHQEDLLGVSASAYTKNSSTSKTNNRITESISSGQAGVNLLINSGFERGVDAQNTAAGWSHSLSGGAAACRGSDNGSNYSGQKHYNLYNAGLTQSASICQSLALEVGETYTFSAYVNTTKAEGFGESGGFCLSVFASYHGTIAESIPLDYVTDTELDNGWQRVSLTFVAQYSDTFFCYLTWENAQGLAVVDDVQLEKGSAASRFNHVYNGSFENSADGWSSSGNGTVTVYEKDQKHGNISLKMTPAAPEASMCAKQTIELNKSSDTTFLLSAWSIGDSIPDLDSEIAGKSDNSLRYWG